MERTTHPGFNSDLPPTPAYHVDIEPERSHHGSCSRCQECGGSGDERAMSSDDERGSSCPCRGRTRSLDIDQSNPPCRGLDTGNADQSRKYTSQKPTCDDEVLGLHSKPPYGRKWEYFPGKNNFYCDGRVMTAPTIRFCLLSFGLILVTFGLFIVFDGPFLAERATLAIPIIGSVLFLLVMVNMIRTSCSDPGILPRASQQEHEFIERTYGGNSPAVRPPPRTKDIIVNGQTVKSKYCFTCKMFRPPRASHCGVCDNCVERFDHHCPFLGNCIGKRNYRSFYVFIISLSLLAVFILSCSITHLALLSKDKGNFLDALRESPTSAVVVLISFFGMWTVIGLAGFHTYLIAMEQTTNEDIKGLFGRANAKNPYSRGNFCLNCCFVLCGPYQPSLINPRGVADSDFLASMPKKNTTEVTTQAPLGYARANAAIETSTRPSLTPFQSSSLQPNGVPQIKGVGPVPVGTTVSTSKTNGKALTSSNSSMNKAGGFIEVPGLGPTSMGSNSFNASQSHNSPIEAISIVQQKALTSAKTTTMHSSATSGLSKSKSESPLSLTMVELEFAKVSPGPGSSNLSSRSNRLHNGSVAISMDGNAMDNSSTLENLTMINSPLHLDTIM